MGSKADKTKVMLGYLTAVTGSMNNRQVSGIKSGTKVVPGGIWWYEGVNNVFMLDL